MNVKLPKAMTVYVGRAAIRNECRIDRLNNPALVDQAVMLYGKEIADDEKEIAKSKGDEKKVLGAKLAEKKANRDAVKALKPEPVKASKKDPK